MYNKTIKLIISGFCFYTWWAQLASSKKLEGAGKFCGGCRSERSLSY